MQSKKLLEFHLFYHHSTGATAAQRFHICGWQGINKARLTGEEGEVGNYPSPDELWAETYGENQDQETFW